MRRKVKHKSKELFLASRHFQEKLWAPGKVICDMQELGLTCMGRHPFSSLRAVRRSNPVHCVSGLLRHFVLRNDEKKIFPLLPLNPLGTRLILVVCSNFKRVCPWPGTGPFLQNRLLELDKKMMDLTARFILSLPVDFECAYPLALLRNI